MVRYIMCGVQPLMKYAWNGGAVMKYRAGFALPAARRRCVLVPENAGACPVETGNGVMMSMCVQ